MAVTLFLVRHAVHDRVAGVLCGRMPGVHLSDAGHCQAAALAARLAREAPCSVQASPQPRAQETAAPIAARCGLDVLPAPALDEIDVGDWTGRRFADLADDPRWRDWNTRRAEGVAPGGEAMRAVQDRVLGWAMGLTGTVVAVSHADVIKALLAAVLDLSLDAHWRFEIAPASVSAIRIAAGQARLLFLNEACA